MKKKLYLGNGIYLSMFSNKKKKNEYKVVLEFYDEFGKISRRIVDYCYTYIDAYYHYKDLQEKYFSLF